MREILFRGKTINNDSYANKADGDWVYGYVYEGERYDSVGEPYSQMFIAECDTDYTFEVDEDTIGEYTGITNQWGEKLFEGDIVVIGNGKRKHLIEFDYGCFYYTKKLGLKKFYSNLYWGLRVIGNIHDDKEMLNETSNTI